MKIQSLYFKNGHLGWEVKTIAFQNLNLLVGLSGAGKSQIINALWHLKSLALGEKELNNNGVEWAISCSIGEFIYEWKGSFTTETYDKVYKIKTESIRVSNGYYLERRDDGLIYFKDSKGERSTDANTTPEGLLFSLYKSSISKLIIEHFLMMNLRDHTQSQANVETDFYQLKARYTTINKRLSADLDLEKLQNDNYNIAERLLIAYKKQSETLTVYSEIMAEMQSIFPEIDEWRIEEQTNKNTGGGHIEYKIKLKGQSRFIPHWNIASGMLRTFNIIADLYLSNPETVFLLDEFENSLGHNCLPNLEELIMTQSIDSQFIITSHHPDIINKIPKENWLIIERTNGSINNTPFNDLGFSQSFHAPYSILMNHFDAFLVEGRTELNLYPKWIAHFTHSRLTKCLQYADVVANQFTIFDVQGISNMSRDIPMAISSIIANNVFDYLVIVIDGDKEGVASRQRFIESIINDPATPSLPTNCQLKIIVQNVCIETWFTGHTDHFRTAKMCRDSGILSLLNEYNVENNDPELMPSTHPHSVGTYHAMYLKKMLKGANRTWHYGKSTAHTLIDMPYFQRLEQRLTETPTHLNSFADMVTFLKSL
jgi:predicted ATPase